MSQEGVAQGSQASQLSEEEKEKAMDSAMIALELSQLGIIEIELMLTGCLSHPDAFTLESMHRRADEALDHNDLDKAIQWTEKSQSSWRKEKSCVKNSGRKAGSTTSVIHVIPHVIKA